MSAHAGTCAPPIVVQDETVRTSIFGMAVWKIHRWPVSTVIGRLAMVLVFSRLAPRDQVQVDARNALVRFSTQVQA